MGPIGSRLSENGCKTSFWVFRFIRLELCCFLFSSITLMAWAVLGKTFNYLNPSNVVPDRVKSALDTLAEGLVLIAPGGEIAHLNEAFARIINVKDDKVLGTKLDDFNWAPENESLGSNFPWVICQKTKERGVAVKLFN